MSSWHHDKPSSSFAYQHCDHALSPTAWICKRLKKTANFVLLFLVFDRKVHFERWGKLGDVGYFLKNIYSTSYEEKKMKDLKNFKLCCANLQIVLKFVIFPSFVHNAMFARLCVLYFKNYMQFFISSIYQNIDSVILSYRFLFSMERNRQLFKR